MTSRRDQLLEQLHKGCDYYRGKQEPCPICAALVDQFAAELQEQKDGAYRERDLCVALLARLAYELGYPVGIGHHKGEWEEEWRTIVYIDLPTGQISWHVHDSERAWFAFTHYRGAWDGHTTAEKYERLLAYAEKRR